MYCVHTVHVIKSKLHLNLKQNISSWTTNTSVKVHNCALSITFTQLLALYVCVCLWIREIGWNQQVRVGFVSCSTIKIIVISIVIVSARLGLHFSVSIDDMGLPSFTLFTWLNTLFQCLGLVFFLSLDQIKFISIKNEKCGVHSKILILVYFYSHFLNQLFIILPFNIRSIFSLTTEQQPIGILHQL